MIAQVRAAFTAGTCFIIPEDGRLVKRKKQKSRKMKSKALNATNFRPYFCGF